ncbi:hypothetical protein GCM10010327_37200 [Streptomyces nitrosporeus]|nr:hypothetical protein GCM10010327_37200 [Streptomyces nitrosporeus]
MRTARECTGTAREVRHVQAPGSAHARPGKCARTGPDGAHGSGAGRGRHHARLAPCAGAREPAWEEALSARGLGPGFLARGPRPRVPGPESSVRSPQAVAAAAARPAARPEKTQPPRKVPSRER